ncbi:MAG TPA: OsmC family protein [Polyangiaceae bacterium]|nr:OsmC family protein [Polyangiaceae bacterium]
MSTTESKAAAFVPAVTVTGNAASFLQSVQAGRHVIVADEPAASGGGDQGPDPYDLLLSALGTCTSMTVGLYARNKGIPLEGIVVQLSHQRIHAGDCAECETKAGFVAHIRRFIQLRGALSAEQRQRLLQIADKCPVHRTLTSEIRITTELVD